MEMKRILIINEICDTGSTGKICVDIDFGAVRDIASAITPVPGGVGPMTIAMLLQNTVTAYNLQNKSEK